MPLPKVVADTNVIISGLLWSGAPHDILKLARNHKIVLFSSLLIVDEVSEVLARGKFADRLAELRVTREEIIEAFLRRTEIVKPSLSVSVIKNDPDDNAILECALAAEADFIISGDSHLLKIKTFQSIPIINPRKFLFPCA